MKKVMYLHTIDNVPARYEKNGQICYVNFYGNFIGKLVPSLKQIKEEQKLSVKWRRKMGFKNKPKAVKKYGWIRVEL